MTMAPQPMTMAPSPYPQPRTLPPENIWRRNDIKCLKDSIQISIPAEAVPYPLQRYLMEPTVACTPTFNRVTNRLEHTFKLTDCGTKLEIRDEGVVYTNELRVRGGQLRPVLIKCVYNKTEQQSASFESFDKMATLEESGQGSLRVRLVRYTESSLATETKGLIPNNQLAYFRLYVEARGLLASAEKCSVYSNMSGMKKTIIVKGCPATKAVKVDPTWNNLAFSFPADLVGKKGRTDVKCDVVLCSKPCYLPCSVASKNRRRRGVARIKTLISARVNYCGCRS